MTELKSALRDLGWDNALIEHFTILPPDVNDDEIQTPDGVLFTESSTFIIDNTSVVNATTLILGSEC